MYSANLSNDMPLSAAFRLISIKPAREGLTGLGEAAVGLGQVGSVFEHLVEDQAERAWDEELGHATERARRVLRTGPEHLERADHGAGRSLDATVLIFGGRSS